MRTARKAGGCCRSPCWAWDCCCSDVYRRACAIRARNRLAEGCDMRAHDVNARAIAYAGLAIAFTVAAVVAAVFLLLRHWDMPPGADSARLPYRLVIDGPPLQS